MSGEDEIGSLAEEAMKLVETLIGNDEYREHVTTCTWCPVCQFVNAIRNNPQIVEQFVSLAVIGIRAAKAYLEDVTPPEESP